MEPLDHDITSRIVKHRVVYLYPPNKERKYCKILLENNPKERIVMLKIGFIYTDESGEYIITSGPFLSACHGEKELTDLYLWYAVKVGEKPSYESSDADHHLWEFWARAIVYLFLTTSACYAAAETIIFIKEHWYVLFGSN